MRDGGNAAAVVCGDYPDLSWAASRIALYGNYQAGQSCIAVRRVIVHRDVAGEEVFGPVLVVSVVDSDEDAFAAVNDSAYGLQAGVFTTDVRTAFAAYAALRVGGVVIGDVPSYRADQMPYGGVKASGVGREGVRAAMDDYTDPRVLVLTGIDV